MKDYTIRPMKTKDQEIIMQNLTQNNLPTEDLTEEKLRNFFVAENAKGLILGCVGIEIKKEAGLLRSLYIDSPYRGQGIGKRLVKELEAISAVKGVAELYLLTTTAEGLFRELSYKKIDREAVPDFIKETEEFRTLCPGSAACMYKKIAAR